MDYIEPTEEQTEQAKKICMVAAYEKLKHLSDPDKRGDGELVRSLLRALVASRNAEEEADKYLAVLYPDTQKRVMFYPDHLHILASCFWAVFNGEDIEDVHPDSMGGLSYWTFGFLCVSLEQERNRQDWDDFSMSDWAADNLLERWTPKWDDEDKASK